MNLLMSRLKQHFFWNMKTSPDLLAHKTYEISFQIKKRTFLIFLNKLMKPISRPNSSFLRIEVRF